MISATTVIKASLVYIGSFGPCGFDQELALVFALLSVLRGVLVGAELFYRTITESVP